MGDFSAKHSYFSAPIDNLKKATKLNNGRKPKKAETNRGHSNEPWNPLKIESGHWHEHWHQQIKPKPNFLRFKKCCLFLPVSLFSFSFSLSHSLTLFNLLLLIFIVKRQRVVNWLILESVMFSIQTQVTMTRNANLFFVWLNDRNTM